jgi:hypothetical protein
VRRPEPSRRPIASESPQTIAVEPPPRREALAETWISRLNPVDAAEMAIALGASAA